MREVTSRTYEFAGAQLTREQLATLSNVSLVTVDRLLDLGGAEEVIKYHPKTTEVLREAIADARWSDAVREIADKLVRLREKTAADSLDRVWEIREIEEAVAATLLNGPTTDESPLVAGIANAIDQYRRRGVTL